MNLNMKEAHSEFPGALLSEEGKNHLLRSKYDKIFLVFFSSPLVKSLSNTPLLVSLHGSLDGAAKMEIFDISLKNRVNKVYSFEEVSGSKHKMKIHSFIFTK